MIDRSVMALCSLAWLMIASHKLDDSAHAQVASWSDGEICRAGIAAILLLAPRSVEASGSQGAVHYYAYRRKSDQSVWRYKCMVDGGRILWGSVGEYSDGRWRVNNGDEVVLYQTRGGKIVITQYHPDGSRSSDTFARSEFAD